MTRQELILIGAGGHAISCIDVIESNKQYYIKGLFGTNSDKGKKLLGYNVLGNDADLQSLPKLCCNAMVCIGQIKTPAPRIRAFSMLNSLGYVLPTIISPLARVSPHATIGAGSIIMHGAIVNAGVIVGENCIINSHSLLEHGVKIGNHSHISTGVLVNGDVEVGIGTFVGSGSQLKQNVRIGERCLISMGSKVFSNVEDDCVFR